MWKKYRNNKSFSAWSFSPLPWISVYKYRPPFSANSNHFDNEISAGYSEDSDYTSDLNYPVGQHANSSASQFRSAAHQMHTPQRSLETSRENSYERDDGVGHHHHLPTPTTHQHHLSPGTHRRHHQVNYFINNLFFFIKF